MKLSLQFITHPAGKGRLVVLPESQFRMLELAAAAKLASPKRPDRAAPLPKELLDRIAGGENTVRAVRLWRGLSGRQLAALTGISASMLSQIERTGKTGSTRTFKTLASILDVPLDLIFPSIAEDR
jgi:ribosome-binding protein aMBF1 (putative translation factor)